MRKHADKFKVQLEGTPSNQPSVKTEEIKLEDMQKNLVSAVETKLEAKGVEIKDGLKTELEQTISQSIDKVKQELVELQNANNAKPKVDDATEIEKVQLQRLNSCVKDGAEKVTLQQYRDYLVELNKQTRDALNGKKIELDATIAGFAGFDDSRGGALIIPEVDPEIRQDFEEWDEGLFNAINFSNAMSRTKKVIVDTVEPDENVAAVKETLEKIGYSIDDGCFVSATMNLKDYDAPARITYDEIEDAAFRVENYVNGKLVTGARRKVAKDLWVGNAAEKIKGIINYERGTGYGKVGEVHVKASGTVTMDDIMKLCIENRNKGVLFIDRTTWATVISEKDNNGRYKFELGFVEKGMGTQPFHVDAVVPLLNVPVIFDDGFTLPEAVAKNVKAAIMPISAMAGYRRPYGRLMVKNDMKYREMLLTERYDAVLTKFKYVKLLLGTAA
jgi:HK97 family phage major capsid protein